MEKKEIRQQIFKERKGLTDDIIREDSHKICKSIINSQDFLNAECIYTYMDFKGEASTKELIEEAWRLGKRVAAPKVEGANIIYYYITSYEDVMPGYFQIPEPVTTERAEEEKALLIVPGVAFDRQLHRCGYGKGFYDRYLSIHTNHKTIAIAFDFQVVDKIATDDFDISPQILITPSTCYFL